MLAFASKPPKQLSLWSGGNANTPLKWGEPLKWSRRIRCMSSPQRARKSATKRPTGSRWSMVSGKYVVICDDESSMTPASKRQPQTRRALSPLAAFLGVIRAAACSAQQFTHSASAEMWFAGRVPFQAAERRVKPTRRGIAAKTGFTRIYISARAHDTLRKKEKQTRENKITPPPRPTTTRPTRPRKARSTGTSCR